jgi:hypothetical protein
MDLGRRHQLGRDGPRARVHEVFISVLSRTAIVLRMVL